MLSRVPLTNLRDSNKGGAPLYLGGTGWRERAWRPRPGFWMTMTSILR